MEKQPFKKPGHDIDTLLEQEQWRDAFLIAKKNMSDGLEKIERFIRKDYEVMKAHKDDDPEENDISSALYQDFINISTMSFLPSINNLLKVFNAATYEMDGEDAVLNYDDELENIQDTLNELLEEE